MAIDKKITYEDQRLTKAQQKKVKPANQGGGPSNKELKYYAKKLNEDAPKGEFLAYINKKESNLLKQKGGLGIKTKSGIPSYIGSDALGQRVGFRGGGGQAGGTGDMGGGSGAADGPGDTGGEGGNNPSDGSDSQSGDDGGGGYRGPAELGVTTRAVNPIAMSPVDRSAVSQFSTFGRNTMNQNLQGPNTFSGIAGGIKDYILGGGLIGAGIRGLTNLGPLNNKDFYNEKVAPAGKTNLGFDDYMSARMAGTIDAYGNPTNNEQGGNDNQSVLNSGIAGIQGINTIGEETTDPTNTADTSNVDDMYFNFGTYSNPIYREDLV